MKKFISAIVIAALLTTLTACGGTGNSSSTAPSTCSSDNNEAPGSESAPQNSGENSPADSTPSAPQGEPTFLIGLDGKAILTSEITRLENTDKTAETLTEDDLGAYIFCDGFTYIKEPSGIAYNSCQNPEMFDGDGFLGDADENTNEWKRVYVGDEICGLKVRSANVIFCVNDFEDTWKFPERYLSTGNVGCCEFEGTTEIEGFLRVLPNNAEYQETGELVEFLPCESKLPIMPGLPDSEKGYITPISERIFGGCGVFGEFDSIGFGHLSDMTCDMDGIGQGDIAYARVTLGNIRCAGGSIAATLENVERISDILIHSD